MAARLLRIKAQMLLPRGEGEEAWDDPRAELVRRLLEYQQMREVVDVLERAGEERRSRFARAYLPQAAAPPEAPLALSLSELLAAVDRVLRVTKDRPMHDVVPRAVDVPGAITTIRALLALRAHALLDATSSQRGAEPWQVLSTLLGAARDGEARRVPRRSSPDLSPTWRSRVTPLAKLLEAALFASARPIPTDELAALDPEASQGGASPAALDELREHYDVDGHGVELVEIGGGWQILTRAEYTEAIERAQLASRPRGSAPPRSRRSRSSPIASRSAAPRSRRSAACRWAACSSRCTSAG